MTELGVVQEPRHLAFVGTLDKAAQSQDHEDRSWQARGDVPDDADTDEHKPRAIPQVSAQPWASRIRAGIGSLLCALVQLIHFDIFVYGSAQASVQTDLGLIVLMIGRLSRLHGVERSSAFFALCR